MSKIGSISKPKKKKSGAYYRSLKKYAELYEKFGNPKHSVLSGPNEIASDKGVPVYRCNAGLFSALLLCEKLSWLQLINYAGLKNDIDELNAYDVVNGQNAGSFCADELIPDVENDELI